MKKKKQKWNKHKMPAIIITKQKLNNPTAQVGTEQLALCC